MLRALSTHPPPSPRRRAMGRIMAMLWALPKRNRETDVIRIENAVIALVEKRLLSVEKDRELTMVPEHTTILMRPAWETSAPIEGYIKGQDAPSMLSGRPREMKDRYMTINRSVEIMNKFSFFRSSIMESTEKTHCLFNTIEEKSLMRDIFSLRRRR